MSDNNWNAMFDSLASNNNNNNNNKSKEGYVKKIYLDYKIGTTTLFKAIKDKNGVAFRGVDQHSVPMTVTDKDGNKSTKNRFINCKGKGKCPICEVVDQMNQANFKDSFKYQANKNVLFVGAKVKKIKGVGIVVDTNDKGDQDIGVITLTSSGKLNKAFSNFFQPSKLSEIGDVISELEDMSPTEVAEEIFENGGYVLKAVPSKDTNGWWDSSINAINSKASLAMKNEIDLFEDIYSDKDMTEETYVSAVESLTNIFKGAINFREANNLHEPSSKKELAKNVNQKLEDDSDEDLDDSDENDSDDVLNEKAMELFGSIELR
ncbi:MAG: hypothetical protein EKK61_00095 [Rickettsiales bacterium]|nr:MAG: hypothetical protein EKK61_00095 [Rickettsiales bacterium]